MTNGLKATRQAVGAKLEDIGWSNRGSGGTGTGDGDQAMDTGDGDRADTRASDAEGEIESIA